MDLIVIFMFKKRLPKEDMDQSIKRYASNTEICFIDESETSPVQEYSIFSSTSDIDSETIFVKEWVTHTK